MTRFSRLIALSLVILGCGDIPQSDPIAPDTGPPAFHSRASDSVDVIVVLNRQAAPGPPSLNRASAADIARDLRVAPRHAYGAAFFGFAGAVPAGRLRALEQDPRVLFVEPVEKWELAVVSTAGGQTVSTGFDRVEAERVQVPGSGISVGLDVAIIDVGIDPDHEDLNVAGGRNFTGPDAEAWTDTHGHGTHVAGLVGAKDNGVGIIGVAPGVRLWAVKVCQANGFCLTSDILAGIDWVAEQKRSGAIDFAVANFSISSSDANATCDEAANAFHAAVCGLVDAGIVFALAAGNNGVEKTPLPVALSSRRSLISTEWPAAPVRPRAGMTKMIRLPIFPMQA